jgi:hypothetical protein
MAKRYTYSASLAGAAALIAGAALSANTGTGRSAVTAHSGSVSKWFDVGIGRFDVSLEKVCAGFTN